MAKKKVKGKITKLKVKEPTSVHIEDHSRKEDHLVLYAEYRKYSKWGFLRDPNSRGHYKKQHRAGLTIGCAICGASAGWCCVNPETGATTQMHVVRLDVFYGRISQELAEEQGKFAASLREAK